MNAGDPHTSPGGGAPESPRPAPEALAPAPAAPVPAAPVPAPAPRTNYFRAAYAWCREYVLGYDPGFFWVLAPFILLCMVLYTRAPTTNYIFDEQEALLANPYVNATGGLRYIDAIFRDFWGLPPDRSVGSYRPVPNFLWRALWAISKQPFFHHFYNVLFHAVNGALLSLVTFRVTRRRGTAYLAGAIFVSAAILTEAVSGIVGIADVFGGMGALLAVLALALPGWLMPAGVFFALLFGLFSKESAVVCVPLVPFAALVFAPHLHPERPARFLRTTAALVASVFAFVLYVELRKRWFPSPTPAELLEPLPEGASQLSRAARAFLLWFHQAPLPRDPLNNPLAEIDLPHRIAGALRVYFRGLVQVVFPRTLSGDYSFPQEPAPERLVFAESVLGGLFLIGPPLAGIVAWIVGVVRERAARREIVRLGLAGPTAPGRPRLAVVAAVLFALAPALVAIEVFVLRPRGISLTLRGFSWAILAVPVFAISLGLFAEGTRGVVPPDAPGAPRPLGRAGLALVAVGLVWLVVSYFPHSNIPVVLPTVRAERFWYFPVIGTSLVLAVAFAAVHERLAKRPRLRFVVPAVFVAFFVFQCVKAYTHAMDYRSDLTFWEATKDAVPMSAKAHLNFSVMKGARQDMETRLAESRKALELAPDWAMAHVYTGDTLCRMGRPDEAWPHYEIGFGKGANEIGLLALGLQCLYDVKKLKEHEDALRALAEEHPGTWLAYLAIDTLDNGEKHGGVDPKHRPRNYNEGPKDNAE
ncbi:tetratricopeptide repeat protein [Polyangium sorediatum]|uniref:Tetratricopeptide repeat protein n=1 Tax=Polyangium sorediatum TaxID=889274 RepID=A0ABT6NYW9_9BACT|nr:tetratricopeptide repeat protein [Polyangium sorediatum]MDI1433509.1 tetratricopeptide repeat protein [Polyangium sorediatum]